MTLLDGGITESRRVRKTRAPRRKFNSLEERREARLILSREYSASLKGKEARKTYLASPEGQAMTKKHNAKRRALRSPEEHRKYNRAWAAANPEKAKIHRRRKALRACGLDRADPIAHWKREWILQGQACKICRSEVPGSTVGWHTDHCHATGQFRGILCHKCNITLGNAGDDLDRLRRCVEYLEKGGRIPCQTH